MRRDFRRIAVSIDTMPDIQVYSEADKIYKYDVEALRVEFKAINVKDDQQLAAWFDKHPYLRANDIAAIANVRRKQVYYWRARVNRARSKRVIKKPLTINKRVVDPPPPAEYTHAWVLECFDAGYPVRSIARAANKNRETIAKVLIKNNRQIRDAKEVLKSTHPCCNRAWLKKHYIDKKLSQTQCARLAGVSRYTMGEWLVQHGFRTRPCEEQIVVNLDEQADLSGKSTPSGQER